MPKHKKSGHTLRFCRHCACKHASKSRCKKHTFTSRRASFLPNDWSYRKLTRYSKEMGYEYSEKRLESISIELQKSHSKKHSQYNKRNRKSKRVDSDIPLKQKRAKPRRSKSVDCPICLSQKGLSRQMGCGHTICRDCFDSILETETLRDNCPLCRVSLFSENLADYEILREDGWQIMPNQKMCLRRYLLAKLDDDSDESEDSDESNEYELYS